MWVILFLFLLFFVGNFIAFVWYFIKVVGNQLSVFSSLVGGFIYYYFLLITRVLGFYFICCLVFFISCLVGVFVYILEKFGVDFDSTDTFNDPPVPPIISGSDFIGIPIICSESCFGDFSVPNDPSANFDNAVTGMVIFIAVFYSVFYILAFWVVWFGGLFWGFVLS